MAPNTSFPALQWLQYIQDYDTRLVNDDGSRSRVEHYYFRGEKSMGGRVSDGYVLVTNGIFIIPSIKKSIIIIFVSHSPGN